MKEMKKKRKEESKRFRYSSEGGVLELGDTRIPQNLHSTFSSLQSFFFLHRKKNKAGYTAERGEDSRLYRVERKKNTIT